MGQKQRRDILQVEPLGGRLARLRKQRGITQQELAHKMGLRQALISDYERGRIRLHGEVIVGLCKVLKVSADEMLGLRGSTDGDGSKPSLRILRRLKRIESLPLYQQNTLLKTIDTFLKGAER